MTNPDLITPAPAPVSLKKALDEEIIMWIRLKVAKARKDVPQQDLQSHFYMNLRQLTSAGKNLE